MSWARSHSHIVDVENVCLPSNSTSCGTPSLANLSTYKYVFFFGQFLHGVGYSPLYTLGVTYIDESVSTKMSSVYLGIFYLMSVIGPALGYVVGGQFLNIYTDFYAYDAGSLGLTVSSNLWVGAWWLGFLIVAGLALSCTKKIRMNKVSETHQKTENSVATDNGFGITLKDLPKSSKILITNPTLFSPFQMDLQFFFISAFLLAALSTFMPKYIEAQFNIMPSWAAFLIGLITVLGAGSGMIMGGYLIKRLKLQCRGILKFCCIGSGVSLTLLFVFAIRCNTPSFAGVNIPYTNLSENVVCNSDCGCQLSDYDPICGTDGVIYYSPCLAGCKDVYKTPTSKAYSNCSCISGSGRIMELDGKDITIHAEREKCSSNCHLLPVFLTIMFFCMFFTFVIVTPSLQVTLRCVAESQRSFSLGVQWIFIRVLGSIPGPVVVGALIDKSCNLWQQLCDGSYGSCQSYNNYNLSVTMGIVAFITKLLSVSMFILALYSYKPPDKQTDSSNLPLPPNSATVTTICGKLDRDCSAPVNGLHYKVIPADF
ncbi:Solute carrier organic anion transporter family member 4C1 [Nymphon striatum]|nr:Solute carrier organic anion transporter family member 4C1 [Nymphon striatum]